MSAGWITCSSWKFVPLYLYIITAPAAVEDKSDPEADTALFKAIRENLAENVELIEVDAEINAPEFSSACAEALLKNLNQ